MENHARPGTNASMLVSEIHVLPIPASIKTAITNKMKTARSITSALLPPAGSTTANPVQATAFAPIPASRMSANQSSVQETRATPMTMTIA